MTKTLALAALLLSTACSGDAPATHEEMGGIYAVTWTCEGDACGNEPDFARVHVSAPRGGNMALRYLSATGAEAVTHTGQSVFVDGAPCVRVPSSPNGTYEWCMRETAAIVTDSMMFVSGEWIGEGE